MNKFSKIILPLIYLVSSISHGKGRVGKGNGLLIEPYIGWQESNIVFDLGEKSYNFSSHQGPSFGTRVGLKFRRISFLIDYRHTNLTKGSGTISTSASNQAFFESKITHKQIGINLYIDLKTFNLLQFSTGNVIYVGWIFSDSISFDEDLIERSTNQLIDNKGLIIKGTGFKIGTAFDFGFLSINIEGVFSLKYDKAEKNGIEEINTPKSTYDNLWEGMSYVHGSISFPFLF